MATLQTSDPALHPGAQRDEQTFPADGKGRQRHAPPTAPANSDQAGLGPSPQTSPDVGRRRSPWAWAARQTPTLLVMALLSGLGIYGHSNDWRLPKFAALAGGQQFQPDDWCAEHAVLESQCVVCDPTLLPAVSDHGWCRKHGVPNCALDHPDVAQLPSVPAVAHADLDRAARALSAAQRVANNAACKSYLRRIQFASLEAVQKAGVEVELVERRPIGEFVPASGEIRYDATRFASLAPRVPGTVLRVDKNVGDRVQAGEVLALLDAAEVGRAKTDLFQALTDERLQNAAATRLVSLGSQGIVAGSRSQEAEAAYAQARARVLGAQQTLANLGLSVDVQPLRELDEAELAARLRLLGLPTAVAQSLGEDEPSGNVLPVCSPMDGVLVAREAVAGEVVDRSRALFQVADTSRMWLSLSVPLERAGEVAVGQQVRFQPDGSREQADGAVVWISTAADPQTRMVSVRAELPNPRGQLRDETFGTGQIVLREEPDAIAVPNEAVHWEGCCHILFVRDKAYFDSQSPKVFHVRTVRLGAADGPYTEIIAGVLPGEIVATRGSDVLRAEMLKNNLGEGCVCGE